MMRFIVIFCIFSLTLVSCGISSEQKMSETMGSITAISTTDRSTEPPALTSTPQAPTNTLTTVQTATPTVVLQPTATLTVQEIQDPPAIVANQPVTITQITMFDIVNGWAIGHQHNSGDRILFTQDGGFSWDERTPPLQASSVQNAVNFQIWGYFYDKQTAWAINLSQDQLPPIAAPVVWRTSNAGHTWEPSEQLPITGNESFFIPEGFSFTDSNHGWLLVHIDAGMSHDYSNLFSTSDGGNTWQRLIDPYKEGLQSLHNTGLGFADPNFGWVTKDNLAILPGAFIEQTINSGQTWENIFLPAPDEFDWFNEISQCATSNPMFFGSSKGIVLVNCRTSDDQTFTYTYILPDKSGTWQSVLLPTSAQSLLFVDNNNGWAFGKDLYQSTDGGLSWVKIKTVSWDGQFSFVDTKTGWAVATTEDAIALVFTKDGGKTWQQIRPIIKN